MSLVVAGCPGLWYPASNLLILILTHLFLSPPHGHARGRISRPAVDLGEISVGGEARPSVLDWQIPPSPRGSLLDRLVLKELHAIEEELLRPGIRS